MNKVKRKITKGMLNTWNFNWFLGALRSLGYLNFTN